MLVAAALSLALIQDPVSHDQAVTCTGLFTNVFAMTAGTAERDPTPDNRGTAEAAAALLRTADQDRLAAARREGLSVQASGDALKAWLDGADDLATAVETHLDACMALYWSRTFPDA
jgi:hypothetical protein